MGVFEVVGPVGAAPEVIMLELGIPDVIMTEDELAADWSNSADNSMETAPAGALLPG
jgi:hypothetical protein